MRHKIPKIDERIVEAWTKDLPKISSEAAKIPKYRVGLYGNYKLTDLLMELVSYLKDPVNVIVVPGGDTKHFKSLEQQLINLITEMVRLL